MEKDITNAVGHAAPSNANHDSPVLYFAFVVMYEIIQSHEESKTTR